MVEQSKSVRLSRSKNNLLEPERSDEASGTMRADSPRNQVADESCFVTLTISADFHWPCLYLAKNYLIQIITFNMQLIAQLMPNGMSNLPWIVLIESSICTYMVDV